MTSPSKLYKPALRGLAFGLAAIGLRAATMAIAVLAASRESLDEFETVLAVLPVMNLVANVTALVGVGYSAIAAHRREWGAVLVFAWITSVAAALLDIQPFVYAAL